MQKTLRLFDEKKTYLETDEMVVSGRFFHIVANRLDNLEQEILTLKARLYDLSTVEDRQ